MCILRANVISTLSSPSPPSNVLSIIMRTEPTLQRMLRTLDSDYSKIQVSCLLCNHLHIIHIYIFRKL